MLAAGIAQLDARRVGAMQMDVGLHGNGLSTFRTCSSHVVELLGMEIVRLGTVLVV
jgi:hypothetical protein